MRIIDNIGEVHCVLLGIAKEFHKVCYENDIPYYMLGGTMLGAVRHNGFIPWDDDMDFGIPRPYYDKLKEILENKLSYPYRCCFYKNNPGVYAAIIKIDDCRTVVDDPCVRMPLEKQIGLNIDIFPLDYCTPDDVVLKRIHKWLLVYQTVYVGNLSSSKWKNCIKALLSSLWPVSREEMLDKMHSELRKMRTGPMLTNVFGVWKEKECVPENWYGNGVTYKFEDVELCGIKEFDKYLKQLYGDYMTPPIGDKHIHLNNIYWRE